MSQRSFGARIVRVALRAYPNRFRKRFGGRMIELYHDRHADARQHGRWSATRFFLRTVGDMLVNGLAERLRLGPQRPGEVSVRRVGFPALVDDVRYGVRMFVQYPGISLTATTAIALGVGISTTMFSVVQTMPSPLSVHEPETFLHIGMRDARQGDNVLRLFPRELSALTQSQQSFRSLAAYTMQSATLSDEHTLPDVVQTAAVTPNTLDMMSMVPVIGRGFTNDEAAPVGEQVAVISEAVWRTRYGSAEDILQHVLRLDGIPRRIVGVMAQGVGFPPDIDVWLPLVLAGYAEPTTSPSDVGRHAMRWFQGVEVFGQLDDGVSHEAARVEFDQLATRLQAAYPDTNEGLSAAIRPLSEEFGINASGRVLFVLMFVATMGVVVIACANVANLLVARTIVRSREIAMRSALGASTGRIVSLLFAESSVLAVVGTVAGFMIAIAGIAGINAALTPFAELPSWMEIHVDATVFAFVTFITVVVAMATGILPALFACGTDVNAVLKDEARGASGRGLGKASRLLVMAELIIACGLLIGSAFMMKNGVRVTLYDPPYATTNLMTATVALPDRTYPDAEARASFIRDLEERLNGNASVMSATVASNLPGTGRADLPYQMDGELFDRSQDLPLTRSISIRPSFFPTFEVQVITGRAYSEHDALSDERVLLVNESFARSVSPDGNVIGRQVRFGTLEDQGDWSTIIGVVPNMWTPGGFVYQTGEEAVFPLLRSTNHMYVAVRGHTDAAMMVPAIRAEVAAIDHDLAPTDFMSMKLMANRHSLFYASFGAAFLVSGTASMFLAIVGLYSVMAFTVTSRAYEMGVRMALGARAANVIGLILRQGLVHIGVGLCVGLVIGVGLALVLQGIVTSMGGDTVDMHPIDPALFAVVLALLGGTGLAACAIPARRATRVDPMIGLRKT